MNATAIFDIGKTNKKFFLFDEQLGELYRSYENLEETVDEDGFPCENLDRLSAWMTETFREVHSKPEFNITRLNFSTYGASFVHLDEAGNPVAPLYNYLKPFPDDLSTVFFERYGPAGNWSVETASPPMGMLNSGLQLYWLKQRRPEVFARIRRSLHLPQYCAFLFSGQYGSEYTSIGCHTGLWDFENKDYHRWVYAEQLDRLLPEVQPTQTTADIRIGGKTVRVGMGIHDSSAALLPYIRATDQPFLLISTGTWSITLNPFCQDNLSAGDLEQDCLLYLRTDGLPVRAARLFLGNEYDIWVRQLAGHFRQPMERHRRVLPDAAVFHRLKRLQGPVFHWESIRLPGAGQMVAPSTDLGIFNSYEEAYHQLMVELTDLQIQSLHLARGSGSIRTIYVDGGFTDNPFFIQLLGERLPAYRIIPTHAPLGSALGAALAVQDVGTGHKISIS